MLAAKCGLVPEPFDFNAVWPDCYTRLKALFNEDGKTIRHEAAPLYFFLYKLSVATPQDHLIEIYQKIGELFAEEAVESRRKLLNCLQQRQPLINTYATQWGKFARGVKRVNVVCMYINKVIEKCEEDYQASKVIIMVAKGKRIEVRVKPVGILGLYLWKSAVLNHIKSECDNVLVREILGSVAHSRASGCSEESLSDLEDTVKSFYYCDPIDYLGPLAIPFDPENPDPPRKKSIFESDLELPILEATKTFYQQDSTTQISKNSITAYVRYVEQRLSEEIAMANRLFPAQSASRIVSAVEAELIVAHTTCLQQEFTTLLASASHKEIKTVYNLLKRLPDGIDPLVECFESFVAKKFHQAIEDIVQGFYKFDPPVPNAIYVSYVTKLGMIKRDFARQIKEDFDNDDRFLSRLNSALSKVLAARPPGLPVEAGIILSEFLDKALTNEICLTNGIAGRSNTEEEFNQHIDDCLALLDLLTDREPFIKRYLENFAKRLIFRLSEHGSCETGLVSKLGAICGKEMQVRMHKMFVDMHSSTQIRDFHAAHLVENSQKLPIQLNVRLATYVVWPLPTSSDKDDISNRLLLPELDVITQSYNQFYRQHWPNRRLHWLHYLSRVNLTHTSATGKRHELVASVPQANVLLRFKSRDSIKILDLCSEIKISWQELHSIVTPIISIGILKWTAGEVNADKIPDSQMRLEFNCEWQSEYSLVILCPASLESRPEETTLLTYSQPCELDAIIDAGGSAELSESRKYFLQCMIIKALKSSNELSPVRLAQLVAELASRPGPMKFMPSPLQLKSMLDVLIEKQYVEYDERRDLYMYMA